HAGLAQRAHALRHAGELSGGDELAPDLHHEPAAHVPLESYGHSPGSFRVRASSKPIMTLKLWMACPAPPLTRLSRAEKHTADRRPPKGSERTKPTST